LEAHDVGITGAASIPVYPLRAGGSGRDHRRALPHRPAAVGLGHRSVRFDIPIRHPASVSARNWRAGSAFPAAAAQREGGDFGRRVVSRETRRL